MRRLGAIGVVALTAALAIAAFSAGRALSVAAPGLAIAPAVADETYDGPGLTVKAADVGGLKAGQIMAGDRELFVMAAPAGGLSGYERAVIIAGRVNDLLRGGAQARDFSARYGASASAVTFRGQQSVVTVTSDDAKLAETSVRELANRWATALSGAAPGDPVALTATSRYDREEWRPSEPYRDKFVPILSVLRGVRIGMARVNGPESKVDLVQAVGQLELRFRDLIDIEVYVPISTKEPGKSLSRVQSVGVTGVGDLKL